MRRCVRNGAEEKERPCRPETLLLVGREILQRPAAAGICMYFSFFLHPQMATYLDILVARLPRILPTRFISSISYIWFEAHVVCFFSVLPLYPKTIRWRLRFGTRGRTAKCFPAQLIRLFRFGYRAVGSAHCGYQPFRKEAGSEGGPKRHGYRVSPFFFPGRTSPLPLWL